MRRINKNKDSRILKELFTYKLDGDNKALRDCLEYEQQNFCAYTEVKFTTTYARDIDHFNPKIKGNDGYYNWYVISTLWNRKKSSKWNDNILLPYSDDFELRIWYNSDDHIYECKELDIEANNLLAFLDLNNKDLVDERKQHIECLKLLFETVYKKNPKDFRNFLLNGMPNYLNFRRALETVFNIKL